MTTPTRESVPSAAVRRHQPSARSIGALSHRLGRYGLLLLLVLTLVSFSLARPEEFATWDNVKSTLDQQTPVIIGGLAVMIPLLTDSIDLSVGANISLANILTAGLTTNSGLSTPLAVVAAILATTAVGLINGLIVERLQVTSFVATLGMATLLGGVGLAYSHSADILTVPSAVTSMVRTEILGLPLSVYYGIVCLLVTALVLRYLPVGRKLRAVGANPRAAALSGIQPGLYRVAAFTLGGTLAGVAGVVLTGQLGSATASGAANSLLLPIFAAVFLGSTAFTPGRQNVTGLFVAVLFLAFVSSGLVLLGAPLWASPLVNGAALILAVALSSWALRIRARRFRVQQLKQMDREEDGASPTSPAAPNRNAGLSSD
ncbi:ABC transporter permease [Streptomyces sp. NPDC005492]|uniref:ABC transporter permease n=1 Tax=Streptomyces sp. NPDC005492 TaxID=3156883 RepID=UPI0033A64189